jgi:hypothetical protein
MRARRRFRFRMVEGFWLWAEYFRLRGMGNASGSESPGPGRGLGGLNRFEKRPAFRSGLQKPARAAFPDGEEKMGSGAV